MATVEEQLNAALARIAALESSKPAKQEPAFDQKAFANAFARDPVGAMKRFGIDREQSTQILVAQALRDQGQQVPAGLEAATAMGPVRAELEDAKAELAALRQRVDAGEKTARGSVVRESLKILAADKKKYPHLATAYTADPDLFAEDIEKHGGTAAELADALEKRQARVAKALGVPQSTSSEKVDDTETAQRPRSTDGTVQAHASPAGDPPTLPNRSRSKGFSEEEAARLRDEVVANAAKGVYDNPSHPYRPQ